MHDKLRFILNSNVGAEVKIYAVRCSYSAPSEAVDYLDKVLTSATFAGEYDAITDSTWLLSQRHADAWSSTVDDKLHDWLDPDKFIDEPAPTSKYVLSRKVSEVYTTLWNFSRKPDYRCESINLYDVYNLELKQSEYECMSILLDWFAVHDSVRTPECNRVMETIEKILECSWYECSTGLG